MNLIKKLTATLALTALVSGMFTTSVSAANSAEIEAANKLAKEGIVVDRSDNTALYELNRNVLRQEIAAVARGIAEIEKTTNCEDLFKDVSATKPNTWACYTVEALRKADMIAANKYFRPESNITKSEAIGMLVKAAYDDKYTYDPSKDTSWQKQVVDFANSEGIVETFTDYNALATRGFVFKAAANCLDKKEKEDDIICKLLGTCEDDDNDTNTGSNEKPPVISGEDVLMVELSPETPKNGNVAAGAARTKMLAFDVTAGNTDVTLSKAQLKFTGLGDASTIKDIAIYDGNRKVTKGGRKFYSDNTSDLTFERDIVVKAGETKTFFVTSTIDVEASNYNQTLRINLVDLQASSTVKGDDLVGATLTPVKVSNIARLELDSRKLSGKITVGKEVVLADFKLEEKDDKENVKVKSVTFEVEGSVDTDDLSDLVLYADGKKIDSKITVGRSEIIVDLDHTIESDKNVDFVLKGNVTGSVNNDMKIFFEENAIYAVGDKTNVTINVDITGEELLSDMRKIEGSEINVAFNRSDIDEAKPGADDVVTGDVKFITASDYTIEKLSVKVKNNTNSKPIKDILKTLELDGVVYDKVTGDSTSEATFIFEDTYLKAGEEKKMPLTFDLIDEIELNGIDLSFTVKIEQVKDEDNNKTYYANTSSGLKVTEVLSSNSFTAKTVDIRTASIELISSDVNDTSVVLGNGIKTVLYKAKLSVGDADKVTLRDLDFIPSSDHNLDGSKTIEDIVDKAVIKIGNKTFDADINGDKIEFNSINADIAAGADNIEVLLTATLKDNDKIEDGNKLAVMLDKTSVDVENSDSDSLPSGSIKLADANTKLTYTELLEKGEFNLAVVTNGENKDKIKDVVLAGTNSVNLAEVQIQADKEDADIKKISFEVEGTSATGGTDPFSNTTLTKVKDHSVAVPTGYTGAQVVSFTLSSELKAGDRIVAPIVGGTAGVADMTSTSQAALQEVLDEIIDNNSDIATGSVTPTTVTLESTGPSKTVNLGTVAVNSVNGETITVTKQIVKSVATPAEYTLSFNKDPQAGDKVSVSVNGTSVSHTFASGEDWNDYAALLQGNSNIITTTVSGKVITVIGEEGKALTLTKLVAENIPGTVTGDFSDTLKNVRLVSGSSTLASGAKVKYDSEREKTIITFEDFKLPATDSKRDAIIVADLAKYTTSGSETTAALGEVKLKAIKSDSTDYFDVEGVNSQEDLTSDIDEGLGDDVTIVPVLVTVSISNKFGSDDQYAKIKFTVDKGNNILDEDDVVVEEVTLEKSTSGSLTIRNDDNENVVTGSAGPSLSSLNNSEINNNDEWEFKLENPDEIRIVAGGIKFIVDSTRYSISNDKIIDLGSYSK